MSNHSRTTGENRSSTDCRPIAESYRRPGTSNFGVGSRQPCCLGSACCRCEFATAARHCSFRLTVSIGRRYRSFADWLTHARARLHPPTRSTRRRGARLRATCSAPGGTTRRLKAVNPNQPHPKTAKPATGAGLKPDPNCRGCSSDTAGQCGGHCYRYLEPILGEGSVLVLNIIVGALHSSIKQFSLILYISRIDGF